MQRSFLPCAAILFAARTGGVSTTCGSPTDKPAAPAMPTRLPPTARRFQLPPRQHGDHSEPEPRVQAAHTNNVEVAKKGDIDLLFMGDSITDWWRNPGRGGAD